MDVTGQLLTKLRHSWPPADWADLTLLVAVSGGADSVALARGLSELRISGEGRLVLAHYNHRLRGSESDADEAFVKELAERMDCQILVGAAEQPHALTSEADARQARYQFLAAAAGRCGARYIATAHTADDQVETVLHNILRGTGLAGLAGIPRTRVLNQAATIIRPLLAVTRREVLDYLRSIGQDFRDDSSNQTDDYTRNRIRRHLLPLLETEYSQHVRGAIGRLSQIARETCEILDGQAQALLLAGSQPTLGGIQFDLRSLQTLHPGIARHALLMAWKTQQWPLQDMNYEKWEQLLAWALAASDEHAGAASQVLPGNVRAERSQTMLRLTKT